eukprot:jgi/Chlat1/5060/Chrsp33S08956
MASTVAAPRACLLVARATCIQRPHQRQLQLVSRFSGKRAASVPARRWLATVAVQTPSRPMSDIPLSERSRELDNGKLLATLQTTAGTANLVVVPKARVLTATA